MTATGVHTAGALVLAGIVRGEGSLASLLPPQLDRVSQRDRGLLMEMCYGTLRWYPALEAILRHLMDKPLKARDAEITALLAAALYQLRVMRTPDHAAVNEAVAATRALKRPWARGLVNGLLRRYLREREAIDRALAGDPAYTSAHPAWLRTMLAKAWPEQSGAIFHANNSRPPMTLRVNRRQGTRQGYQDALAEAGITARAANFAGDALYLAEPVPVESLPGFAEGRVSVQDEASQLAADLLDPAPGQRVLDACCAPGGKTCHILESQPALSELVALDIDGERLARVTENLDRLGLSATLQAADAGEPEVWWDGRPFQRILVDAPCSATGVIRRHPDIKLLRQQADIDKLAARQLALLQALWPTLDAGGVMLYTTCSVLPVENGSVIARFVDQQENCQLLPLDMPWGVATGHGRQLLPAVDGCDGFYYAMLRKRH